MIWSADSPVILLSNQFIVHGEKRGAGHGDGGGDQRDEGKEGQETKKVREGEKKKNKPFNVPPPIK